jgi:hypothetical protein
MPNATYSVSLAAGGVSIQQSVARTGDHPQGYEVSLPVGKAGTLTTRTDNDTGVLTVASGHGITASDFVDVYWNGGVRYGMDVTATTATTISVDLGAGDNLPAQDTTIVVTKQVVINTHIDGDAIQVIGFCAECPNPASTAKAHIDMQDVGAVTIEEIDLSANVPVVYDVAGGAISNLFTGNPITVSKASNGSAVDALILKIVSLEDSTP